MSSPNNNSTKKRVLNTVLNTVRIVKSFSVKAEKRNTLDKFQEFCRREHITFSDGILWAIEEFLQRHMPPNPQPTLDRCLALNMPVKPNTICFVPRCRAKPTWQITLQNFKGKTEIFNVCSRHKKWKHRDFRFIVTAKPLPK